MSRRPLHAHTRSTGIHSFSSTSTCRRPKPTAREARFCCSSGFLHVDHGAPKKAFTSATEHLLRVTTVKRRLCGDGVVCNAGGSYGNSATLYFDGGSRGPYGPGGSGAYLLRPNGDYIWEGCKFFEKANSIKAEFQGLIMGLKAAKEAKIKNLRVIGDCDAVVESMRGERRIKSDLVQEQSSIASRLADSFKKIRYTCIHREENGTAHKLATSAMKKKRDRSDWYN